MTLRFSKRDVAYGLLAIFICGLVVGVAISEVDRRTFLRDRLESLNGTLDTIEGR